MIVPKRPRLLGYWLCQGDLGFIFAPRGVGKTWLAMALPTAISRSEPMGAWEAGEMKAKVLYVDGEMPLQLTQYRARGLRAAEGDVVFLHHDLLFEKLECSLNIASVEHQQAITALLLKENCNVVILDNLSSLASGVDENKGFHYEGIATWLLELRRRKITVVVIHHAGRNGMMRGHSKREDACSWILELKDAKAEGEPGAKFVSHFAKPSRNTGDSQADLLWHFTTDGTGRVNIQCEAAQATEFESMVGHIIDGVENQGDLAELMKVTKGTTPLANLTNDQILKSAGDYCENHPASNLANAVNEWYASLPKQTDPQAAQKDPQDNSLTLSLDRAPKIKPLLDRR